MDVIGARGSHDSDHWRKALTAFALSFIFPGAGHVYAGSLLRGCLWSIAYLSLVIPGAILLYIGLSSPGSGVLLAVVSLIFVFLLLGAVGPVRASLRAAHAPQACKPLWLLEGYAALVALGLTLETGWFFRSCFVVKAVKTYCLSPFVSQADRLTVLLSRYVRPVHGDLLLCQPRASITACNASEPTSLLRLGLVLAREGDTICARGGKLLVNGLDLALRRSDQRLELERAGRLERRRRFFAPLRLVGRSIGGIAVDLPPTALEAPLQWGGPDWGPYVVPQRRYYMLLDEGDCSPVSERHQGVFVQKSDIAGRAID